jgi:hypothetical protein
MLSDNREVAFGCPGCGAQIHSRLGHLRHSDEIRCFGCGEWIEILKRQRSWRIGRPEPAKPDPTFWRSFLRTLDEPIKAAPFLRVVGGTERAGI